MRFERVQLEAPASVATGTAQIVREWTAKYIQVSGTFTATINLEGTLDGTNWLALDSGLAAGDLTEIPQTVHSVRCKTTAYTSGTPVVWIAGRMARDD